jgi:hypothetical protein
MSDAFETVVSVVCWSWSALALCYMARRRWVPWLIVLAAKLGSQSARLRLMPDAAIETVLHERRMRAMKLRLD